MSAPYLDLLPFALAWAAPITPTTPPDVVDLRDEVFATGTDAVFVLRISRDNMGSYYDEQIETHLVRIDVASAEETMWLVYRARKATVFDDDPALERHATLHQSREEWHDPFAIIAEAGATLFLGRADHSEHLPQPERAEADTGLLTIGYEYGPTFALRRDDALARMRVSLAAFAERIYDAPRMTMMTTRQVFSDRIVDWENCGFAAENFPVGLGNSRYQIVRVSCDDGEDMEQTSLLQVVRPVELGRAP